MSNPLYNLYAEAGYPLGAIDMDTVKNLLEIKGISVKKAVNIFDSTKISNEVKGREDWTIRDWEKKDAKGLSKIQLETPETYNQMYENFYVNKIGNNLANKYSK